MSNAVKWELYKGRDIKSSKDFFMKFCLFLANRNFELKSDYVNSNTRVDILDNKGNLKNIKPSKLFINLKNDYIIDFCFDRKFNLEENGINELSKIHGICYIIHNNINGKNYVGISQRSFIERYTKNMLNCSNPLLLNDFNKYGFKNFDVYIVVNGMQDVEILCEIEKILIKELKTSTWNHEYGYNLTAGGEGYGIKQRPIFIYDRNNKLSIYESINEYCNVSGINRDIVTSWLNGINKSYEANEEYNVLLIGKINNEGNFELPDDFEYLKRKDKYCSFDIVSLDDIDIEEAIKPIYEYEVLNYDKFNWSDQNHITELLFVNRELNSNDNLSILKFDLNNMISYMKKLNKFKDIELDVLKLVSLGLNRTEISKELGIYKMKITRVINSISKKISKFNQLYNIN